MKAHASAKSSFTLGPTEHAQVKRLRRLLKARSNTEVIRRSLTMLEESLSREELRRRFRGAAAQVKSSTPLELEDLDGVVADGLDDA